MFLVNRLLILLTAMVLTAPAARAVDQEAIDQAIATGVKALRGMQNRENGSWPYKETGATSLASLALIECGVKADDPAMVKAAEFVRSASPVMTETYSITMAILFLDRLGDPHDVPLIESLTVRLLAGQSIDGGWSYSCPPIAEEEVARLRGTIRNRSELKSGSVPRGKRTVRDLPREIQQQLTLVNRVAQPQGGGAVGGRVGTDNSNTQFATLALWVSRRHGLPVDNALARIDTRYRRTQSPDGTWSYFPPMIPLGGPRMPMLPHEMANPGIAPRATMTCAGVLALAVAHGVTRDPDGKMPRGGLDPTRDAALEKALLALGTAIGAPVGKDGQPDRVGPQNGTAYYFLWSLERVALALNLDTVGKKDWYQWGAEVILANQGADGIWRAGYAECGADTSFALLFLRRSNLVQDLTTSLRGKTRDPAKFTLSTGGVGGAAIKAPGKNLKPALAPDSRADREDSRTKEQPKMKPLPTRSENSEADDLTRNLVEAKGEDRTNLIKEFTGKKGGDYTEALAHAIPRLLGEDRANAREALATRMSRLSAGQLVKDLKDPDSEIRAAAILASEAKGLRDHIPLIIDKLDDVDPYVVRAAVVVLKKMTRQDLGPASGATREEHEKSVKDWKDWWENQKK